MVEREQLSFPIVKSAGKTLLMYSRFICPFWKTFFSGGSPSFWRKKSYLTKECGLHFVSQPELIVISYYSEINSVIILIVNYLHYSRLRKTTHGSAHVQMSVFGIGFWFHRFQSKKYLESESIANFWICPSAISIDMRYKIVVVNLTLIWH